MNPDPALLEGPRYTHSCPSAAQGVQGRLEARGCGQRLISIAREQGDRFSTRSTDICTGSQVHARSADIEVYITNVSYLLNPTSELPPFPPLFSSLKLLETDSIALEYKLFKAYTEIQRLVENKSLVPTVRIVHKEEVFEGAWLTQGKPGVVVEVQTEIEALLEYSFDNQNNLANGIWLQDQPADRIEFPYALAKVRMPVSSSSEAQLPAWIQPLVDQGLMIEVCNSPW